MDEHNIRTIAISAELVKRTQATILALAKSLEAMESPEAIEKIMQEVRTKMEPPKDIRHVTAAISACLEYWIMSGYYSREELTAAAAVIFSTVKPLPEGPTRRGSHDHC